MGAAASTRKHDVQNYGEQSVESITAQMLKTFPLYKHDSKVNKEDLELAKKAWAMVVDDSLPLYHTLKGEGAIHAPTALAWFYDEFYRVSFDLDSASKEVYQDNMRVQVRALVSMVTSAMGMFTDVDGVPGSMAKVAKGHFKKGVRAYEYPLVGEALLRTFKQCLGNQWDEATSIAWTSIVSIMVENILPPAIREEMNPDNNSNKAPVVEKKPDNEESVMIPAKGHHEDHAGHPEKHADHRTVRNPAHAPVHGSHPPVHAAAGGEHNGPAHPSHSVPAAHTDPSHHPAGHGDAPAHHVEHPHVDKAHSKDTSKEHSQSHDHSTSATATTTSSATTATAAVAEGNLPNPPVSARGEKPPVSARGEKPPVSARGENPAKPNDATESTASTAPAVTTTSEATPVP